MTATDTFDSDPRLADHGAADKPAWLWSADGTRLLWTNAVGAQIFARGTQLRETNSAARQIARVFAALPESDAPRLERLRGFGAPIGGALLCQCSRFKTPDGDAVLVVSLEKIRGRANEPREAPVAAPARARDAASRAARTTRRHSRQQATALCLAGRCRAELLHRERRLHPPDRPADRGAARQAVGTDRRNAGARPAGPRRRCADDQPDLQRCHHAVGRPTAATSGWRSTSPACRCSTPSATFRATAASVFAATPR